MRRRGFTLTEVVIGLSISLFMAVAAFEFFGITRDLFLKLKGEEMDTQSAEAALDKIRIDFLSAGQGLVAPMRNSTLAGVKVNAQAITVALAERSYELGMDLVPGQTRVPLTATSGLNALREVCLVENGWGEVHSISAVESGAIIIGEPLQAAFSKTGGLLHLLEKISYFLDEPAGVLRRKVNSSPAQPLLEDVASFEYQYDAGVNLARAGFSLQNGKEAKYEISVFPKNIALARPVP
jgi:prepilin-type N-terminal cleavage/methylation domain-containing protein